MFKEYPATGEHIPTKKSEIISVVDKQLHDAEAALRDAQIDLAANPLLEKEFGGMIAQLKTDIEVMKRGSTK